MRVKMSESTKKEDATLKLHLHPPTKQFLISRMTSIATLQILKK